MIGKTRQIELAKIEEVFDPEVGRARGLLKKPLPAGRLRHARLRPASDLSNWIAHYWTVRWDLRGCQPHIAETLPHPNVHVVFEAGGSVIRGVQTTKFSRKLKGNSLVFGIKFKPGGFRPFLNAPVSSLTNRTIPVKRIFGNQIDGLERILVSPGEDSDKVEAANKFFRARMPAPDKTIVLASQLVARIFDEPEIKKVNDLATRSGIGLRSIQRIFSDYVGVSPKWVIIRYRLLEVIEAFNSSKGPDWAQLAVDLGYFDQAHLINEFRSMVGLTPTQYRKLVAKNS
jgi:AraC-like DNA-binding protein